MTIRNQTGSCTISGLTNNDEIEVEITGVFPQFYMNNNATEGAKLLSIDAWGNQVWKSMNNSFAGCSNLIYNATDIPDLSSVTDMRNMFTGCKVFNGNIGTWITSNVTNMSSMFSRASNFNQNIGTWNTDKVTNMSYMFSGATAFNQNVGNLNIGAATDMTDIFNNSGISVANYDAIITAWNTAGYTNKNLGNTSPLKYCASEAARTALITPTASGGKGWTIFGDAKDCITPFKTTWKVAGGNIIIPTLNTSGPYNYTVNYRKKGTSPYTILINQTSNCTISGLTNGDEIEVEITGVFPHFYMNGNSSQRAKLLSIDAWGNQVWKSMSRSFAGCSNLTYNATDNPDLSAVTDMSEMFQSCSKFNGNIGSWITGNVTNMSNMFQNASAFNQNIGNWTTNNVTDMSNMFGGASAFNQNISTWSTGNVTNMSNMFGGASAFNQNIGSWNTSNVINMSGMFGSASAFNQNIGTWITGNVTNMSNMFQNATAFNQNIGTWITGNVTNMSNMFQNSTAFN